MSIAEILHKRPFQTAATLITLCKGQSKGEMMRAVTVDTQCTNGCGQIVEERGGALRALQAHFGTQAYGKLFDTNHLHHRAAQTIQGHLQLSWPAASSRSLPFSFQFHRPEIVSLLTENDSWRSWKHLTSVCVKINPTVHIKRVLSHLGPWAGPWERSAFAGHTKKIIGCRWEETRGCLTFADSAVSFLSRGELFLLSLDSHLLDLHSAYWAGLNSLKVYLKNM